MAGFFTSFGASPLGSALGGAAHQASANIEASQAADKQYDVLWGAKFATAEQQWQKENKDAQQNRFKYQQIYNIVKDPAVADQYMLRVLNAKGDTDMTSILHDAQQSVSKTPSDISGSQYMQSVEAGLKNTQHYMEGIKSGASPRAQKFMTIPGSDQSQDYGNPDNSQPMTNTGTRTDLANITHTGTNKSLLTKELLKPEQFNDAEGYRKHIESVSANPNDPTKWDYSGVKSGGATAKLDPAIQLQLTEQQKMIPYMEKEDRKTYMESIAEARRTGDASLVRSDLLPTQDIINQKAAERASGIENTKKYSDSLQKRQDNMFTVNKSEYAADDMIRMVNSGTPLQASAFQPFVDSLNRGLDAAGIDARTVFGLKANRVQDVNEFKKVLSDLTFDQIPNYHLGRWTNTEFNLLKTSLPSLDTDPNTVVKVALLFKNAAQRERNSLAEETKLAWGQNGERFTNPKSEDLGKAKMHGVNMATDSDRLPWTRIDSRDPQASAQTYNNLPQGAWYENIATGQMKRKGV